MIHLVPGAMRSPWFSAVPLLCAFAWLGACDAPDRPTGPGQRSGAVVVGSVRLAEGAPLPGYAVRDLARKPPGPPPGLSPAGDCPAPSDADRHPVGLTAGRGLAGVVVAASGFLQYARREPIDHLVRIERCRMSPTVVAAMAEDQLLVENADEVTYAPLLGVAMHASRLSPGRRHVHPLIAAGVETVLCTPENPCGRTDVVVFNHPVHTVSDAQGRFRIEDFPAGESVHVSAWHPLFEEAHSVVWVEAGERREVTLVLEPKQRFVAAPAAPPSE